MVRVDATSRASEALETRPLSESITEVVLISVFMIGMAFVAFALHGAVNGIDQAWFMAAQVGKVVTDQVGWALSAYVAILIAFYAVVIGGEIVPGVSSPRRTRRVLGVAGVLIVGVTNFTVAFVVIWSVASPASAGNLVVVLPVASLIGFLGLNLSSFAVLEVANRIRDLENLRARLDSRISTIAVRTKRSPWIVGLVNVVVISLLAVLPCSSLGIWNMLIVLAYVAVQTALVATASAIAIWVFQCSLDTYSRYAIWVLPVALSGGAAVSAVATVVVVGDGLILPAVSAGLSIALVAASLLAGISALPPTVRDWTIRGAVGRLSLSTLQWRLGKVETRLVDLRVAQAWQSKPLSFRESIVVRLGGKL